MIELRNLTKIFRHKSREVIALDNVSLIVPEGKIVGIIGESGAGKSTLIRCVNLLEVPTSGEVYVDAQNMKTLSSAQLTKVRRSIGMIFQHFNLLASRTVFENVAFPLELTKTSTKDIDDRVTALLKLVGLEDKGGDYPSKLSGGQKQRAAIARTLANNPKILLCDEATSALDPATTRSILSLLKEINKKLNITILLITHEMEVVKEICDEVAVMSDGRLIESGTIDQIFSHPRNELTKHFVDSSLHIQIPYDYKLRLTEQPSQNKNMLIIMRISGQSDANTAISGVATLHSVNTNIVCAQMDNVGGVKFGAMLLELMGDKGDCDQAIAFFEKRNIRIEVLGYV